MLDRTSSAIVLVALCLVLLVALPTVAQTTTGTLTGRVTTGNDQPLAGAVLQARSERGQIRTAVTGDEGRYRIDGLAPGNWTLVARLAGGEVSQSRVVEVGLQQTVRADFRVGEGTTEKVSVTAEPPLVDTRETEGKLRVTREQMEALPMSGRSFIDLARLDSSAGSAGGGVFFGERGAAFAVNGQGGRSNNFLVDGMDNNDQVSGTTLNSFYAQSVIQEFVMMTQQYAPEFGRASGGVVNILTRRGGNQPNWQAFVQGTTDSWNSAGGFSEALPPASNGESTIERVQTGFSLGGPIKKDKAFYFLAYELHRTDDLIAYTGIDRDQLGGEVSGGQLLSPKRNDVVFARTDFDLSRSHSLMLRMNYNKRKDTGINVGGIFTPESGFRLEEEDLSFAGSLTSVFSTHLMNEVRVLAARSSFNQFANNDRPGVTRPSGIFGGNTLNEQVRDEQRLQLIDNVTWFSGNHTVKFGVDVLQSGTRLATKFNPNGNFFYDVDAPFDELDILTYPYVLLYVDGQPQADLDDTRVAMFIQDRFRAGSRWQLDYGVRYDVSTYTLDGQVDSIIPNGGASRDTDNWAPRFGFSFTPKKNGKTVLRGGGGVFYDKLVLGFPAVAAITSGTQIKFAFPQGFGAPVTEQLVEELGIDPILDGLPFPDELILNFSTGTELETPYTVQYNLGVEQGVGRHGAFRANLLRALGYHLPLLKDLNPVSGLIPAGVSCSEEFIDRTFETGSIPCHLRDPGTGSIAAFTTEGRSWYTALDLGWRSQFKSAWLNASYTWSKSEDLGFDPLKNGISLPPNSDDLAAERARSDFDRRHRFVLSGDTALPWLGLRTSGVLQFQTGSPFNVTTGADDNLDGVQTDRPQGVGRNSGADTSIEAINRVRDEYNQEIRDTPFTNLEEIEPFTGSLEEPDFLQVDFRLYRPFAFFSERGRGEVFLQVFNLFDRVNVGAIEGRVLSPNFSQAIAVAGPSRTVELGLKIGM